MIQAPKDREEAEKYRYNRWASNPRGTKYDPTRCAYEVYGGWIMYQCQRKPGAGPDNLYCKQHAKRV
jgi:hypothetical protein